MSKGADVLSFRLGGETYKLSRAEVEQSVRHADPRPIDKHYVVVNTRRFPPKQVLSAATGKPVVSFTTMEANRVLKRLGFELGISTGSQPAVKTESEAFFEAYLNARGLANFTFEKAIEGTSARPDFALWYEGQEVLFEVKEFHATPEDFRLGFGSYDPYGPIREKIEAGRKKFRDLKGRCCALVLYNREKPLVDLSWQFIYAAMLGNLAYSFPVDVTTGKGDVDKMTSVFAGGGKMHRHDQESHPIAAQNTTISAVLVLQHFAIGKRRLDIETQRRQNEIGRELTLEEVLDMVERARGTDRDLSLTQLRVIVHENPYSDLGYVAVLGKLFRGPYDEIFGPSEGHIRRLFCGEQIEDLEKRAAAIPAVTATRKQRWRESRFRNS